MATDPGPAPYTRNRSCTLVLTALLLRAAIIVYVLAHFGPAWFFSRGMEMGLLANSILHGRGLSSPFGVVTGPTAMVAPGYPLIVSIVFGALGAYSWASALCLMTLHAVCNSATVLLIYRLGRRLASEQNAFFVALFWACSLPLLWMPTIFWETNMSALMLLAFVEMSLRLDARPSVALMAMYGALCGVAGLINPALVPTGLILAVSLWLVEPRSTWKRYGTATALLAFVIVFIPWPVRNYHTFHSYILTRTTVGLELWMGNHVGGEGYLEPSMFPTFNAVELARYKQLGEVSYMNEKRQSARSYILLHPGSFVLLSLRRCFRFWTGCGSRPTSPIFCLHGSFTILLGCVGLVALWRNTRKNCLMIMLIPLLLFPLPYYVTHAEFKYRLIVDPLLVVLGAVAVDAFGRHLGKADKT